MDEHLVNILVTELRTGFGRLSDDMRTGLGQLSERIDETNSRLDITNARLDQVILREEKTAMNVELLRAEMNTKLDGIGKYLRSINGSVARHDAVLHEHDDRLNKLEE